MLPLKGFNYILKMRFNPHKKNKHLFPSFLQGIFPLLILICRPSSIEGPTFLLQIKQTAQYIKLQHTFTPGNNIQTTTYKDVKDTSFSNTDKTEDQQEKHK